MIDKRCQSAARAVACIRPGMTVAVGGFGDIGVPLALCAALAEHDVHGLTIVSNNAGTAENGLALLFKQHRVARLIASFPSQPGADHFLRAWREREVEVELVPQGTLAERLRAGGSGLAGFFTPTGYGTELTTGKETRFVDGTGYVYEQALKVDVALVKAELADRLGNLRYRLASRNFNPVMAMAARHTIAQVGRLVEPGGIDPDDVHTPGVYVDAVVEQRA
ncbi:MAG TPA: 3-oxoacid CoA-transferase subunit A [Burkholderiaceae bacterium]|nr:3-oxoacid CoA-transferase subunit A [Burkholderiaceae bacterium]